MSHTAMHALQTVIVDALKAAPALADGAIYANRTRSLPAGLAQAVIVRLASSRSQEIVKGRLDWSTSYTVECVAAMPGAGVDPAESVDSLVAQVWARISALRPAGYGLMGFEINSEIDWRYEEANPPVVVASFELIAAHRTTAVSLAPLD